MIRSNYITLEDSLKDLPQTIIYSKNDLSTRVSNSGSYAKDIYCAIKIIQNTTCIK